MKFYDISFMDIGPELSLNVHSRENSTWIAVATNPHDIKGSVILHIRNGHDPMLGLMCRNTFVACDERITGHLAIQTDLLK